MTRRRYTELLETGPIYIDGPDDDFAGALAFEKWRGQFVIFHPYDAERRVYTMTEHPPAEDGVPVLEWNQVTDPAVLESIR